MSCYLVSLQASTFIWAETHGGKLACVSYFRPHNQFDFQSDYFFWFECLASSLVSVSVFCCLVVVVVLYLYMYAPNLLEIHCILFNLQESLCCGLVSANNCLKGNPLVEGGASPRAL